MSNLTIYTAHNNEWRIIEVRDDSFGVDDLKGDMFDRKTNPEIDIVELARQEKDFEREVDEMGVFGYVLEKWNPTPGEGYEHVDSCFGFIGPFSPTSEKYNHYIVEELKARIDSEIELNTLLTSSSDAPGRKV